MKSSPTHLRAIGFALTGFIIWVFDDTCLKLLGDAHLPPYETLSFIGLTAVIVMALIAGRKNIKQLWPKNPRAQTASALLTVAINVCNIIALPHLPLALFYVIVFLSPMIIAILASFFLREHLNGAKIVAIIVGFAGVVIAINPLGNTSSGDWVGYTAALGSVLCFATNMTWLRSMTQTETPHSLIFFTGLVEAIVGFIPMLWHFVPLSPKFFFILLGSGLFNIAGCLAVYKALKHTTASNVSQFHYTQIITGALLGYLIWHDVPTLHLIVGAVIIIGSGLYIASHAHKADRLAPTSPP